MLLNKIIDGIAMKLNQVFGDGYQIYTESVEQGLKEPCFFIVPLKPMQKQIVGKRYFREHPFDIHYFPATEDENTECLNVADQLFDALEAITVDGDVIRGSNINHEIIDDVLHCFVNYDMFIYKESETPDNMESLIVSNDLKG